MLLIPSHTRLPLTSQAPQPLGFVLAALVALAACAPPAAGAAGSTAELVVFSAGDASLHRVSVHGGGGSSVTRVEPGASQLALGANGAVVVLSSAGTLTAITRSGDGWASQPVPPEPGFVASRVAGDGRTVVAAYRSSALGCRVAVVSPDATSTTRTHPVCQAGEYVTSLAVSTAPSGAAVAYVGLWRDAGVSEMAPGGRIVAFDLDRGWVAGVAQLPDVPALLAVAPAIPSEPARVLCACGTPDDLNSVDRVGLDHVVGGWRLTEFDAQTLEPLAVHRLARRPTAIGADGRAAYLLAGGADVGSRASVVRVDLGASAPGARTLRELPGRAAGLAVGGEHVYVPHLDGNEVWAVERSTGRVARAFPVGPRPLALGLATRG